MAEPMMENPLAPQGTSTPSPLLHFMKVIQDMKDCIQELKTEFEDSGGIPINDDIQPLHRFCAKLEFLLQAGLKQKTGLLGGKKDYWNYFYDSLQSNKSLNDGLRFVKSVSELKTNLGRGRAFVRFALMHQRLADTIQQCVFNGKWTGEWYHPKAVWFQPQLVSELINALYDLNDLQFDLSPRGYDLDASWPTFARRTIGSPYSWRPPSRTTSISSLSSIPTMDPVVTPTPSPQPFPDPDLMKLKVDLSVTESEKMSVEKHAEELQKEVRDVKKQLAETQKKCNEYEVKCDKLANELKLKEIAWAARETALKRTAEQAESNLSVIAGTSLESASQNKNQSFDLTELQGKLMASNKRNQAFKMDVQRLEIELESKKKVDEKKTLLIDLLDKKLESVEAKKQHVMNLLEDAIKNKEQGSTRLQQATQKMLDMQKKLVEKESLIGELNKVNTELRSMLSSLEGKGKKVAQVAREKVHKFSADNINLKEEIEKMNQEKEQSHAQIGTLQSTLDGVCSDMLAKISSLSDSSEKWDEKSKNNLSDLQTRFTTLEEASRDAREKPAAETDSLSERLVESQKINEELKAEVGSLKEQLASQSKPELNDQTSKDDNQASANLADEVKSEETRSEAQPKNECPLQGQAEVDQNAQTQSETVSSQSQPENTALVKQMKAQETEMDKLRSEMDAIKSLLMQGPISGDSVPSGSNPDDKKQLADEDTGDGASYGDQDLLTQLQLLVDRNHTLHSQIQSLESNQKDPNEQKMLLDLTKLLDEQDSENTDLKVKLNQNVVRQTELEGQIKETETQLERKEEELGETEGQHESAVLKVEELEDQIKEMNCQLESNDNVIDNWKRKIEQSNNELLTLKDSYEAAFSDKNAIQDKLTLTENKMAAMEENFEGLFQEIETVKEERGALVHHKEEMQRNIDSLQMEKLSLICKLEASEESMAVIQDEKLAELTQCLEEEHSAKEQIQKEYDSLKAQMTEKETDLLRKQDLSEKVLQDKTNELKDLEQAKTELLKQNESMKLQNNKMDESIQNFHHEKETLSKEIEIYQEKYNTAVKTCDRLNVELDELNEKFSGLDLEKSEIENNAKEFNFQFMSVKNDLDTKNHELESVRDTLVSRENDLVKAKEKIAALEKEKDKLHIQISESSCAISDLKHKIQELEVESGLTIAQPVMAEDTSVIQETLFSDTATTLEQSVITKGILVPELKIDNEKLRGQVENLLSEKDEMCSSLILEKSVVQEQLEKLNTEFEDKTRALDDAESKVLELENNLSKVHEDLVGKGEAIETLMQNMELSRDEMGQLRKDYLEKDKQLDELKVSSSQEIIKLNKELDLFKKEKIQKEKELSEKKDALETELSALKFQRSSEQMQHLDVVKTQEKCDVEKEHLEHQVSTQGSLLEDLQIELKNSREDREHEIEEFTVKIQQLDDDLNTKTKAWQLLGKQLHATNHLLAAERSQGRGLKKQLDSCQDQLQQSQAQSETDKQGLEEDIKALKKQIIKLVREKDTLWQKTDKLEYEQKLRASDKWVESGDVAFCMGCRAEFTIILRKHHCRLCGRIFCKDCCCSWVMTPHSSKKERVCNECVMSHSQLEVTSEGGSEHGDSDFMDTVEIPSRKSSKWSESDSIRLSPGDDDDITSMTSRNTGSEVVTMETNPYEAMATIPVFRSRSTEEAGPSGLGHYETSGSVDMESGHTSATNGPGARLDAEQPSSITDDGKSGPILAEIQLGEGDEEEGNGRSVTDELYDVITDEEVLQSITEPTPDPNMTLHSTVTVDEIVSGEVLCLPDLWIKAGKSYAIPVFIDAEGITLCWEFSTQPKGIDFSLTYKENDYVPSDCCELLIPLCKCNSHKQPVKAELVARKCGIYTLMFDNTSSRFTSKKLEYVLSIQMPEVT